MSESRKLHTEEEFYVSIVTDKIRRIYQEMHICPVFNFSDVAKVFDGDVEAYYKHKDEIFKQLQMNEAQIMNFDIPKVTQ